MSKVLVIEDDDILRQAYITKLQMEGFSVDSASNGREGLKKAQANPPDIILLDMLMPNMDGLEFLKEYDLKKKHSKVKVVVFSNASMPGTVKAAIELGASKYLTKASFTPNEMVTTVKEVIGS